MEPEQVRNIMDSMIGKLYDMELEELGMKDPGAEKISVTSVGGLPIRIMVNLQVSGQAPDGYAVVEQVKSLPLSIDQKNLQSKKYERVSLNISTAG